LALGMETTHQSVFELPMEQGDASRCGTNCLSGGVGREMESEASALPCALDMLHYLVQVPSMAAPSPGERWLFSTF